MRIALDARPIFNASSADHPRGRWLTQLYSHLHDVRPDWRTLAYHRPLDDEAALRFTPNGMTSRPINLLGDRMQAWARWRLPFAAWREQAGLVHGTLLSCPSVPGVPTVVSIDHLIPIESPSHFTARQTSGFEQRVRQVCKRADAIVVPTEHLRTQLVVRFQAEPGRIHVVAPGVDSSIQHVPANRWSGVMQRYGLNKPFVLHYGRDVPYRNTRRLIEAWAMADNRIRQRMQLLIVGLNESTGQDLVAIVNRLGLSQSVRLMRNFAEAGDRSVLLSAADITAVPCRASGFPLFMLEAWKTRSAVIAGRVSGMESIAGDAATLVEPGDPCAIARAMKRLVVDARFRTHQVDHGVRRLKAFSWQYAADSFVRLIEDLANVPVMVEPDEAVQRKAA